MTFERLEERWRREAERKRHEHERRQADVIERARPVLERFGIRRAVLFGSLADGRSTERSDVDLLVRPLPAERYWDFRHELEAALGLPLDVLTQDDDPALLRRIEARGLVIHERDP